MSAPKAAPKAMKPSKAVSKAAAKHAPAKAAGKPAAKPSPKPISKSNPLKGKKTTVSVKQDEAPPAPLRKPKKVSKVALEIQQATSNALPNPMKVRQQHPEIKENQGANLKWAEEAFWAFFGDEIETMAGYPAEIFNDRAYSWRCECCDVALRVPRRTTVFHGDYEVQHDDQEGLLVNGERHVPGAYTQDIQVVQPGRLRNPWSGKLIEGKSLGTTGAT